MKRGLLVVSVLFLLTGCYDHASILERLDTIENEIGLHAGQMNALEKSIQSLKTVNNEIKALVNELRQTEDTQGEAIVRLEESAQKLDQGIKDLTEQHGQDLSELQTWAESTFVTLEVYNALIEEFDLLKKTVNTNSQTLDKKIDKSVADIKLWVNNALNTYCTSDQVDEKLQSLKERLSSLETRLDSLLRVFKITFDDLEVGILPGSSATVHYTIVGSTSTVIVKAFGQSGWTARVEQLTNEEGNIHVTAPDPLVDDEIVVIVYDGEFRTIMSSVNFLTGKATPSVEKISTSITGGSFDLSVESNMDYSIVIPEEAAAWLSVNPAVKATRTDAYTVTVAPNTGDSRKAEISLVNASEDVIRKVLVEQGGLKVITVNGIEFKMVEVKGGDFEMGSSAGHDDNRPPQQVTLTSTYYIGQTEVTQKLWESITGSNPSYYGGKPDHPVERVSWDMIRNNFLPELNRLTGLNFDLPTEAQWEFAARGGNFSKKYNYSGSDNLQDVGWYNKSWGVGTHPVGQKTANELGIYDMSGNVSEWCFDNFSNYQRRHVTDPVVTEGDWMRIIRGGNFFYEYDWCTVYDRQYFNPDYIDSWTGFRLKLPAN